MSEYIRKKNVSITMFDNLPTEIILDVFDYLSSNEIIYSFFYLNQRLQNLLIKQQYYINYLQLPISNFNFWQKILSIIGSQIELLIISHDYLTLSLDYFSNLKSIIITSPYSMIDKQFQLILQNKYFQKLHTLKIKNEIVSERSYNETELDNEQILFKKVFDNENNLQVFEYLPSLTSLHLRKLESLNINFLSRSLKLNLSEFKDIFSLIKYTPNLIYLNIQSEPPCKYFKEDIHHVLSTFKTQFWLDHNWNIGLHQSGRTYIYSLAFQFNELNNFSNFNQVLSNNEQILHDNRRLWSNITSIELVVKNQINLNLFQSIKINMPKLSSIKLIEGPRNFYIIDEDSYVFKDETHDIDVTLNSVTTVHLEHTFMDKFKTCLIYVLPNLKHLILTDTKLPSRTSELHAIFYKRIKRLEVGQYFLQIEKFAKQDYIYFSNLQDLRLTYDFTLNEEELGARPQMIMKILTNVQSLRFLSIYAIPCSGCSRYTPDAIFQPILTGLDRKQIGIYYEIKRTGQYLRFVRKERLEF
ncbi:unnamed protein product [Rotaria sp. Silwood1]|nr:unnamed protein product [Rotaria sp. Silwood1]